VTSQLSWWSEIVGAGAVLRRQAREHGKTEQRMVTPLRGELLRLD